MSKPKLDLTCPTCGASKFSSESALRIHQASTKCGIATLSAKSRPLQVS